MWPSDHWSVHIRRRRLTNPTRNIRRDNGQRPLVTFWMPIRGERERTVGGGGDDNRGGSRPLSKFIQTRDPIPIQYFSGCRIGYERTHISPLLLDSATAQFSILYRPLPPPIIFARPRSCPGIFPRLLWRRFSFLRRRRPPQSSVLCRQNLSPGMWCTSMKMVLYCGSNLSSRRATIPTTSA